MPDELDRAPFDIYLRGVVLKNAPADKRHRIMEMCDEMAAAGEGRKAIDLALAQKLVDGLRQGNW